MQDIIIAYTEHISKPSKIHPTSSFILKFWLHVFTVSLIVPEVDAITLKSCKFTDQPVFVDYIWMQFRRL